MKTKVLALILAILCFSMSVVACNSECTAHIDENKDAKCDKCEADVACTEHVDEDQNLACDVCTADLTPACAKHVDANNDKQCDSCNVKLCDHKDENADNLCDACGGAIVAVNVQIPPVEEERVEMVVGTIPSDAKLDDYVNTTPESKVEYNLEEMNWNDREGYYAMLVEPTENGLGYIYKIFDLRTGDTVFNTVISGEEDRTVVLDEFYFTEITTTVDEMGMDVVTYKYYTYDGALFYKDIVSLEDEMDYVEGEYRYDYYGEFELYYNLRIGDLVYIFDPETKEMLFKDMNVLHFVDRPAFEIVNENYGYVCENYKIYVYDLSKWIDCVYVYDVPMYAVDPVWYVLENGNVVLQWSVMLSEGAASYDYWDYSKYDLVTVMIDLEEKSAKEIEFGYVINDLYTEEYPSIVKENVLNLVEVYPIVNDRVEYSVNKVLAVDNALTILFDFGQVVPEDVHPYSVTPVGDGLFLVNKWFANCLLAEVINEKGEHVNYLPDGAYYNEAAKCVEYENKFYNVKMELLFDPEEEGYSIVTGNGECNIYSKYNEETEAWEYFFYNFTDKIVKIDLDVVDINYHELGFVLLVETVVEDNFSYEYRLYNSDNTLLATSQGEFSDVYWIDDYQTGFVYGDVTYVVTAK